ncbi:NUDIX hydrolase [Virgibacillus senegalensis]|uniref:NUDIX hydrolase n=1 Tax=Virgibacillus senegalensis TaxID=1499679 RepID=UPI00069D151F|nr:NUDIX hydrolase [Virgibacillus senegalensis]
MKKWFGSAGICVNQLGELLMVLQGKPEEVKKWTVPSGGWEQNETFEACCMREMEEETGYLVEIGEEIKLKSYRDKTLDIFVEVHYFLAEVIGGERVIQDPDDLIYDISWKSVDELKDLELCFPEDRDFLIDWVTRCQRKHLSQ